MSRAQIMVCYDMPRGHKKLTGDYKFAGLSLDFRFRCSQLSIKGRCGRGWNFGMPELSIVQFILKAFLCSSNYTLILPGNVFFIILFYAL